MTKKKHEELVEEIAGLFNLAKLFGYPNKMDGYAEKAITLILSAIRDGRLELPGEVGRWKWPTLKEPNEGITAWTGDMLRTGNEVFIALRGER